MILFLSQTGQLNSILPREVWKHTVEAKRRLDKWQLDWVSNGQIDYQCSWTNDAKWQDSHFSFDQNLKSFLKHFSSISQACCTQPGKACKKQNWCCKLLGSPSINTFFLGVPHVLPWTSNPNAVLSGSRLSRTWSTMKHLSFRNEAGSHWHWACHGYPTISRESCGILYGCQWVETTTELHLCF